MTKIICLLTLISLNTFSCPLPPVDMTFKESQILYRKSISSAEFFRHMPKINDQVQKAIDGGERLNSWIKLINKGRSEKDAIRLTNPKTRRGIPINKPSKYSEATVEAKLSKILKKLPNSMIDIIYNGNDLTKDIPKETSKKEFEKLGLEISRNYQSAVRWTTIMIPHMGHFKNNKTRDIRGFYHLKKITNLDAKLKNFKSLGSEEQKTLKKHLIGVCINSKKSSKNCTIDLKKSLNKSGALGFKNKYWKYGEKTWASFFNISNPRKDIEWTHADQMIVTFVDPKNKKVENFLEDNIEAEFKFKNWALDMRFIPKSQATRQTAKLKFKAGTTPHVTQWNIIVMDANSPLEEWDTRWTIRHEYGHVLRLPDCYHEFYDEKEKAAINYQIDTTDLMCSRAGDMNERIYKELKRVYYK